jgi:hypothetical protein
MTTITLFMTCLLYEVTQNELARTATVLAVSAFRHVRRDKLQAVPWRAVAPTKSFSTGRESRYETF